MSDAVITAENISKRYHIGARQRGYRTFRDAMADVALAPYRRIRRFGRSSHREEDTIWAVSYTHLTLPTN